MKFIDRLTSGKPVIIDGAMGTLLMKELPGYQGSFELLNVERPDLLESIHALYFEAGADIVETNTFGGSRLKLEEFGLADRCEEINEKGAVAARTAADRYKGFVGGSAGPTGRLVEPMGEVPAELVYESYKAQFTGLERGGADAIIIETMNDIQEAKLALLAAKDATSLPVICSMTFEENGTTMTGTDMLTAFATLTACGADAVGANCSMGPDGLVSIYSRYIDNIKELGIPLTVWANAGLPEIVDGSAVYKLGPDEFSLISQDFARMGISLIGGCCGTTPEHITALSKRLKGVNHLERRFSRRYRYLTSRSGCLDVSRGDGLLYFGERLNPTARKKFAEELKEGKQSFLRNEAKEQVREGAHALDINVGVPGIDEIKAMHASVSTLSTIVNVPLMIDSDNSRVLEKALMIYPGVPLINSINGKESSIEKVLPLLKRFGAFAVALCLDDSGIHPSASKRIAAGDRLLSTIEKNGIDLERIFVDPLMLAESAEPGSAMETLKVIEYYAGRGIKTSLGLSNISFGLPQRKNINNVYLKLAQEAGLTAAIVNPRTIATPEHFSEEEKRAHDFLTGRDPGASAYIEHFKTPEHLAAADTVKSDPSDILQSIYLDVVEGNSDEIADHVRQGIDSHKPADIMENGLIRALEKVGDLYSTGEYFLPQMIASANAMKKGFALLKPLLSESSDKKTGIAVICTVKGDIHDIGKNIVAMMLENHGFEVHDLGKDVAAETIIEHAEKVQAHIICLSSLLTTTMSEMKTVSDKLRERKSTIKLMVGGAVVTEEYAHSIGAAYGKDAVHGVNQAKKLLS